MSRGEYLNVGLPSTIERYARDWPTNCTIELTVAVYVLHSRRQPGAATNQSESPSQSATHWTADLPQHLVLMGTLRTSTHGSNVRPLQSGAFVIGIYIGGFGNGLGGNEIFAPFVGEMRHLQHNNGQSQARRVVLRAFVVDALAAALLTCGALPTDLYGCCKCILIGEPAHVGRPHTVSGHAAHTVFAPACPDDCERLDEDFVTCVDRNFHRDRSVVTRLGRTVGLASQLVLDYRHVICGASGVLEQLWHLWTADRLEYRLNRTALRRMQLAMNSLGGLDGGSAMPPLAEASQWRPTEWRRWLLYYGPIVLESTLPTRFYTHFVCLHLAVRLMLDANALANAHAIGFLMRRFVGEYALLYGMHSIGHSVHSLLHIESAVLRFGPQDAVSGFAFEETLGWVERLLGLDGGWCAGGDRLAAVAGMLRREEAAGFVPRVVENRVRYVNIECALMFSDFRDKHTLTDNYFRSDIGVVQVCYVQMLRNGCVQLVGRPYRIVDEAATLECGGHEDEANCETPLVALPNRNEPLIVFELLSGA